MHVLISDFFYLQKLMTALLEIFPTSVFKKYTDFLGFCLFSAKVFWVYAWVSSACLLVYFKKHTFSGWKNPKKISGEWRGKPKSKPKKCVFKNTHHAQISATKIHTSSGFIKQSKVCILRNTAWYSYKYEEKQPKKLDVPHRQMNKKIRFLVI